MKNSTVPRKLVDNQHNDNTYIGKVARGHWVMAGTGLSPVSRKKI